MSATEAPAITDLAAWVESKRSQPTPGSVSYRGALVRLLVTKSGNARISVAVDIRSRRVETLSAPLSRSGLVAQVEEEISHYAERAA